MAVTMTGAQPIMSGIYAMAVAPIGATGIAIEAAASSCTEGREKVAQVAGRTLQLIPMAAVAIVSTYPNYGNMFLAGSLVLAIPASSEWSGNIFLKECEEKLVGAGKIASIVGSALQLYAFWQSAPANPCRYLEQPGCLGGYPTEDSPYE
jgi:hypothetical protein